MRAPLLLAVLLAAGCCPKRYERPTPVETAPSAEALLAAMRGHADRVVSLELVTRMEFYRDAQALKGTVEALGKRPGKLRFEALDPAGANTLAVTVSDGQRFFSHERGKPDCYTGRACAENVSRLIPLPFDPETIVDVLVGAAPVIEHDSAEGGWDDCEGAFRVRLRRGEVRQTIWLRPQSHVAHKTEVFRGDTLLFRLTWKDVAPQDGIDLPRRIRFESDEQDTDLSVDIREAWLNQVDSDKPFEVRCPQNTSQRLLPCRK